MLKKQRILTSIIALMLCVVSLTSCVASKTDGSNGATLKLTVWNTQGTDYVWKDLEEDIPTQWLTDKTGVYVQNIYGNDGGQWDSKLTKLVSGDNLPDIVWCQSAQGPAHFNKLLELDKLSLLTEDMLKEHAPNIWKRTPSYVWEQFRTEDGKLTGIPFEFHVNDIDTVYYDMTEEEKEAYKELKAEIKSSVNERLYIRDDILKMIYPESKSYDEIMALLEERQEPIGEELMDIPIKSSEEFIDFMYKIRDLNLEENGKKVYAFGYAGDGTDNWEALVYLGNLMYGTNWHRYTGHWNTSTNKVELPLMDDFIKEMARTQNQMILDKVIDPESLAHTGAQFQAKVFQGTYAICGVNRVGTLDVVNKQIEESGGTFNYRPFWVDIPSPEGYAPFDVKYSFYSSFCILNTLSEEDVIKVLKWADLQFTDEFMEINAWGRPEDELYTEDENGKRVFKDEAFNKFFIYGDSTALDEVKTKGLNNYGKKFRLYPLYYSKYTPDFMARYVKLNPTPTAGFKFMPDSKYVQEVLPVPPACTSSSEFGSIDEVVKFWSRREEWEMAIKKAIAAQEGEFDAKWDDMKALVDSIVGDHEVMEEKMTEVALPYWEAIKAGQ